MLENIKNNRTLKKLAQGQVPVIVDPEDLLNVELLHNETPINIERGLQGYFEKLMAQDLLGNEAVLRIDQTIFVMETFYKASMGVSVISYHLTPPVSDHGAEELEEEEEHPSDEDDLSSEEETNAPPAKRRRVDIHSSSHSNAELESYANNLMKKVRKLFFGCTNPDYHLALPRTQKMFLLNLIKAAGFRFSDVNSFIEASER